MSFYDHFSGFGQMNGFGNFFGATGAGADGKQPGLTKFFKNNGEGDSFFGFNPFGKNGQDEAAFTAAHKGACPEWEDKINADGFSFADMSDEDIKAFDAAHKDVGGSSFFNNWKRF